MPCGLQALWLALGRARLRSRALRARPRRLPGVTTDGAERRRAPEREAAELAAYAKEKRPYRLPPVERFAESELFQEWIAKPPPTVVVQQVRERVQSAKKKRARAGAAARWSSAAAPEAARVVVMISSLNQRRHAAGALASPSENAALTASTRRSSSCTGRSHRQRAHQVARAVAALRRRDNSYESTNPRAVDLRRALPCPYGTRPPSRWCVQHARAGQTTGGGTAACRWCCVSPVCREFSFLMLGW